NFAKTLSYLLEKPLLGIHHIEGHIYANYINPDNKSLSEKFHFPALALVVSGGHTQ
ncbi:MAG TPA: tRNA (adenosine(37)-N6)-threonylcarbamoyltransferase complex transferase subunit TsaD, partial [Candidatus Moranbacteria bacterium]|nr:tRNA (adenosine(37)-N6)-threonylcarbamoyltransferase complex transferase subunit TsaD [Candidatus Moranbacteria bacterium]